MSNQHFNDRRPTPLEEQAYAEAKRHFAEHLKQFTASRDAIQQLDETLTATARAATQNALRDPPFDLMQTEDGARLQRCADLGANICICHCPSADGGEFAVVESLPLRSGEVREILAQGREAMEVLKRFISDQGWEKRNFGAKLAPFQFQCRVVVERSPGDSELKQVFED